MISILSNEKCCFFCKTTIGLHKHHIFFGANRKKSDKDGCWVYLCAKHHNMSDKSVHFDRNLDLLLKKKCEQVWIDYYGKSKEDFRIRYGKNYL